MSQARQTALDSTPGRAYARAMDPMPSLCEDLDATGLLCPLPVLKARKRLLALPPGALLRLRADDPAAIVDVPHFCAEAGHLLQGVEEADGAQLYLIRKRG